MTFTVAPVSLSFHGCTQVTRKDLSTLQTLCKNNKDKKSLSLSLLKFQHGPYDLTDFMNRLTRLYTQFTTILLDDVQLNSSYHVECLGELLMTNRVVRLSIANNRLFDLHEGLGRTLEFCYSNKKVITSIESFVCSRLGGGVGVRGGRLDKGKGRQVKEQEGEVSIFEKLFSCFPNLKMLDVAGSTLSDEDIHSLVRFLPGTKLVKLGLYRCGINEAGVKKICEVVSRTPTLTSVYLGGNPGIQESIREIGMMVCSSNLTKVDLNSCNLTSEHLKTLAPYVRDAMNLSVLDVEFNYGINFEGVMNFLTVVGKNHPRFYKIRVRQCIPAQLWHDHIAPLLSKMNGKKTKLMLSLVSTKYVPRVATRSKLTLLTKDMFRLIHEML